MKPDILIIGQGLAGSLLAWELERAGCAFAVAESGDAAAASHVAAGMINPITGRRLVKSAHVETLLPVARQTYRALELELGVSVWREMRVRRIFANERERRVLAEKTSRGELAPFLGDADDTGFWIEQAAHVDLRVLLATMRERLRRQGRLREARVDLEAETGRHALVVDCTGLALARGEKFGFVPWRFSKGEILEISVTGLARYTILNCGTWVLPMGDDGAWVGATHEPGVFDREPTARGRATLETAAGTLLDRPFQVTGQRAGVRVNLPDKRPVVGRHPLDARCGLINGLGAKGALLAPTLAKQWVAHVVRHTPFEAEFDVARFGWGL